jgi:transposase-like protein
VAKIGKNQAKEKPMATTDELLDIDVSLKNIAKKWTMPIRDWKSSLSQFSIMFHGRLPTF